MNKSEVTELFKQMTLAEKVGQLVQLTPFFFEAAEGQGEVTGPMAELGLTEEHLYSIGSVLGTHTSQEVKEIQKAYLKKSRLGIPLIFMADVIHGYETIFPIPLGIGASWNPKVAQEIASWSAVEASEAGVHVTFSPMVDLVRDPRWGRVLESTGEDPYLNSLYAKAFVEGYQGEAESLHENFKKIAACIKHFAAYGASEAGKEYNTVDVSTLELYQYYLPSFRAAIDAGAKMMMTSFNTVNGIPATGNRWLMKEVLRDYLNFDGMLISDWGAVGELISYGVAADGREASQLAIEAGVDMDMMTSNYAHHLEELVTSGAIDQNLIDESVLRVLHLKNDLGLFEDPYRGLNQLAETQTFSKEIRSHARRLAAETVVLLKNEQEILPLKKEQKIAVIGPKATDQDVLGAWSWVGQTEAAVTLATGIKSVAKETLVVGTKELTVFSNEEQAEMMAAATQAEVVVLALGESSEESGEAASKATICLPDAQISLLKEVAKLGKPIVTVLFNGRPLELAEVTEFSTGIIEAWFPGTEAGNSVADVLFGRKNPSGKLPMSFPVVTGQIPVYYNHLNTGRPLTSDNQDQKYVSRYLDIPNDPLYPFGFGLSYTTFELSEISLNKKEIKAGEQLVVTLQVQNTGSVKGTETIQLYLNDQVSQVARPVRELKRMAQVTLEPLEISEVTFELSVEDLAYIHQDLSLSADLGGFDLFIGTSSLAPKVGEFHLIK